MDTEILNEIKDLALMAERQESDKEELFKSCYIRGYFHGRDDLKDEIIEMVKEK